MNKLLQLLSDGIDAAIIAFLAAAAAVTLVEEWRSTKGYYFVGAWFFGIIIGIAAQRMGVSSGWDIIVTATASITAPMTVAWLRSQTLLDALDKIRKSRDGSGDSSGGISED